MNMDEVFASLCDHRGCRRLIGQAIEAVTAEEMQRRCRKPPSSRVVSVQALHLHANLEP